MGDPKFSRKKYETPTHPWQGIRISDEAEIMKKYGLKNKREVWKAQTFLRGLRGQARKLQALQGREDPQAERETDQLLKRLNRLGLLDESARLDDVLALNMEGVLNRRLQTQVYLKGLASTPDQARQLIVHGHILVDGGRVTVPSYRVTRDKEDAIEYAPGSPLQDPEHPVRPRVELTDTSHVTRDEPEPEDDEGGEDEEADEAPEAEAEGDDEDPEAEAEDDVEPEADEAEGSASDESDDEEPEEEE